MQEKPENDRRIWNKEPLELAEIRCGQWMGNRNIIWTGLYIN